MDSLISIDYEIAGDGSGDVVDQIIRPVYEILRLFRTLNVEATFFVEIEELLAFRRYQPKNMRLIGDQLRDIRADGHEIALHLHPQWRSANYDKTTAAFQLNPENSWVLGEGMGRDELLRYLRSARSQLENLLSDVSVMPQAIQGFRAGGYSSSNYDQLLGCLVDAGFSYDASALSGASRTGHYVNYDYQKISGPFSSRSGILVLPVTSVLSSKIDNFSVMSVFDKRQSISRQGYSDMSRLSYGEKLARLFHKEIRALDWTTLRARDFYFEIERRADEPYLSVIGHSKTFRYGPTAEKKLRKLKELSSSIYTHRSLATKLRSS